MSTNNTTQTGALMRDRSWLRKSFMMSTTDLDANMRAARVYTTTSSKFTNTEIGGNFTINNPPQYTRYADIRAGLRAASSRDGGSTNLGMGRFYGEQLDDNAQVITMRFGVPAYKGMLTFFTGFYDQDASTLARTGRSVDIFSILGNIAGAVVGLRFIGYIAVGVLGRFFFSRPGSKYYYMTPAMGPYWNRVNFIANALAVNLGIVPKPWANENKDYPAGTDEEQDLPNSKELLQQAVKAMPDVFLDNGRVDVYSVANRAHRMSYMRYEQKRAIAETSTSIGDLLKQLIGYEAESVASVESEGIDKYLERYNTGIFGNIKYAAPDPIGDKLASADLNEIAPTTTPSDAPVEGAEATPAADPTADSAAALEAAKARAGTQEIRSKWTKVAAAAIDGVEAAASAVGEALTTVPGFGEQGTDELISDLRQGSAFVSFWVAPTGEISESFTSSTRESDIASTVNGGSSTARNARFSFSDGNTGIGIIDGVIGAVKSFAAGALDSIQLSGLMTMAGSAFVDIPQHWDSSSASFPTSNFTIELRTPYGNKLSRYLNLYIPLAMLLAGALPLSTGRQSFASPFLCEMYYRGRNSIKLGMITDLSITRGTGNMGWNNQSEMLGMDVTFTVKDMSGVIHAPIDTGFNPLRPFKGIFDEDSAFSDYLAVLGNLSMADQIYPTRKLALNLAKKELEVGSYFSRSHLSNALGNGWPGRLINTLSAPITGFGGSTRRE